MQVNISKQLFIEIIKAGHDNVNAFVTTSIESALKAEKKKEKE